MNKQLIFPKYARSCLACGGIMLIASCATIYKISKGSRSKFAYTLMAFTLGNAIQDIAQFVLFSCPQEVLPGTYYFNF